MKFRSVLLTLTLITANLILALTANAQSVATATQPLRLSAFVAGTYTTTNLARGKNLQITAGADLTLLTFRVFKPSVEVRGTYPIDKGNISSQKNILVGPKIEYPLGRLHPYADLFVGRGKIDYNDPGFIFGNFRYDSSTTIVYSPGVGLDYNLTHDLEVKIDAQFQHWNTPATDSGTINPTALTLGAIYNFDFNSGRHHDR
jgi:Outer membrane protein beta-barrel domain